MARALRVPCRGRRRTLRPPFWSKLSRVRLPLDDGLIRVLTLHAGNPLDPIVCSLEVAVLADRPLYEALSYTWGDPDITETIYVDGTQVAVTVNLENALR
jgi:hypothetical protein